MAKGPGKGGKRRPPDHGNLKNKPFDLLRMLRSLNEHGVSFLVIGGVAGTLHGSPTMTRDLDICYERSWPNLTALASVLRELNANLRGADAGLPFQLDAKTLQLGDNFTFETDAGSLDCIGTPDGTNGYPDLIRKAAAYAVGGITVKVVGLDDLIRMKQATGRPKDRIESEVLNAVRAEIDGDAP